MASDQEVQDLVREMYESAMTTPWNVSAKDIRSRRRRGPMVLLDPKSLALVAVAAALIIVSFFVFGQPASHKVAASTSTTTTSPFTTTTQPTGRRIVVPELAGLSQAAAADELRAVGMIVGTIATQASKNIPAGYVIASMPPAGSLFAAGGAVDLKVSSGPTGTRAPSSPASATTVPVTQPASAKPGPSPVTTLAASDCNSGNVSYAMAASTASTCVKVGARLTVTFSSGWSYGSWSDEPPTVSDGSILNMVSYVPAGKTATAVFNAVGTGTTTIFASFNVTCAPGDTTPCTVPPGYFEALTLTIIPS